MCPNPQNAGVGCETTHPLNEAKEARQRAFREREEIWRSLGVHLPAFWPCCCSRLPVPRQASSRRGHNPSDTPNSGNMLRLPREQRLLLQEQGHSHIPRAIQARDFVCIVPIFVGPSRSVPSVPIWEPCVVLVHASAWIMSHNHHSVIICARHLRQVRLATLLLWQRP